MIETTSLALFSPPYRGVTLSDVLAIRAQVAEWINQNRPHREAVNSD